MSIKRRLFISLEHRFQNDTDGSHRLSMKTGFTFIFAFFFLCGSHILSAQTLFTWTDEDGVSHITDRKPPDDIQIEDKLYYEKQPEKSAFEDEENRNKKQAKRNVSEAFEMAEIEKRKAKNAKQKAQEAFTKANQVKKETDEYIQKVKYKSRKRKSLRIKMKRRMEEANRVMAEAEQLNQLAIEAEKKAKEAEFEAKKLEEEAANQP